MSSNTNARSQNKRSGCFSGIARILLCKRNLQTHPTDQNAEPNTTPIQYESWNKDQSVNIEVVVNVNVEEVPGSNAAPSITISAAPAAATGAGAEAEVVDKIDDINDANTTATAPTGVVARLMGLDALPKTNWVVKGDKDLVTRSRSANFMDYILEFDLSKAGDEKQQRRVRTSVSFREVPTTLSNNQNKNHDFLVLYLEENNDKKAEFRFRKTDSGIEEVKPVKEEKIDDEKVKVEEFLKMENENQELKDDDLRKLTRDFSKFGSSKGDGISDAIVSPKKKKGRVRKSKVKSPEKPMNQKEMLVESKFMKKFKNQQIKETHSDCSSEESSPVSVLDLDDFINDDLPFTDYSSIARSTRLSIDLEPKELKKNDFRRQKKKDSKYHTEIVKMLCKLIEEDVNETKWVVKDVTNYEEIEDICVEFGQEIVDDLVKQVVKELVGFHLKSFIDGKVF